MAAKCTWGDPHPGPLPEGEGGRLPLGHERVIEDAGAADLFGAEPELFADQLIALRQDEREGRAIAAQIDDLPRLAAAAWGKQDALEAQRPVREVREVLLDDQPALLEL